MRAVPIAILSIMIAGCMEATTSGMKNPLSDAHDPMATQFYGLSNLQEEAIKAAVRQRAANPESVAFGPMTAGRFKDGRIIVCGEFSTEGSRTGLPYIVYSADELNFDLSQTVNSSTYGICARRGVSIQKM